MIRPSPRDVAQARDVIRADKNARKADRSMPFAARPFPGKAAAPKVDDGSDYMAWLHYDIPCIGCLVFGQHALVFNNPIEAAHQKLQVADRGWHRRLGRRGSHWTCAPLCAGHHRIGPLCCDPAQAKFWGILGLELEQVVDFVEELNSAFRDDRPGAGVVHRYATLAAAQRVFA